MGFSVGREKRCHKNNKLVHGNKLNHLLVLLKGEIICLQHWNWLKSIGEATKFLFKRSAVRPTSLKDVFVMVHKGSISHLRFCTCYWWCRCEEVVCRVTYAWEAYARRTLKKGWRWDESKRRQTSQKSHLFGKQQSRLVKEV